MSKIILDRQIANDQWQTVADEQALPDGQIIVSFNRWQSERDALLARDGACGIQVNGETAVTDFADDLQHFEVIALEFPAFADGRCYSHARLLRERYGYTGQLRAVGDVLIEQLQPMARCGINAFAMRADQDLDQALQRFDDFSVKYQAAVDEKQPLYRRRAA